MLILETRLFATSLIDRNATWNDSFANVAANHNEYVELQNAYYNALQKSLNSVDGVVDGNTIKFAYENLFLHSVAFFCN